MTGKEVHAQVMEALVTSTRVQPLSHKRELATALAPCIVLTAEEAASVRNWFMALPTSPPPPTISLEQAVALLTPEGKDDA